METAINHPRAQREAGLTFFGKLRHTKAAMYMGKSINPHTNPGNMYARKKARKVLKASSSAYPKDQCVKVINRELSIQMF